MNMHALMEGLLIFAGFTKIMVKLQEKEEISWKN